MPTAFVLFNCELGKEGQVIQKLHEINSIKEVNGTFGSYDIIAKIESQTVEEVKDVITKQIRNFDVVTGTLTLMGIEGQS